MPKRKSIKESKEDRWRRKMKKYEEKLGRKTGRILYSSDEESDQGDPPPFPTLSVSEPELCEPRLEEGDGLRTTDAAPPPGPAARAAPTTAAPDAAAPDTAVLDAAAPDAASSTLVTETDLVGIDPEIDPTLLLALGDFVPEPSEWGEDINDNLAKRWEPILKDGLKKEVREEILKKYLLPNNCQLSKPPTLNPEVAAVLTESSRNRDTRILKKQSQIGCALAVIGKVVSGMLKKSIEAQEALRLLSDASKLIADSHHTETDTRRALITPLLEKSFVESFKDRKRDSHLFGEKLGDFIKSSRGSFNVKSKFKREGPTATLPAARLEDDREPRRWDESAAARPAPPPPRRRSQAPASAPARQAPPQAAPARRTFAQRAPRRSITDDSTIIDTILGYKIPFICEPHQNLETYPKLSLSKDENIYIEKELSRLTKIKAIRPCKSSEGQFISSIFVVPKSNGEKRLILNLKNLNKFVKTQHFKMEDIRTASRLVTADCYMVNLDLKEAYFLVPIYEGHTKYLRFYFKNALYEFLALPFGLCSAPHVFTKLMRPVSAHLRSRGFKSVQYLDDSLLIGDTFQDCLNNLNETLNCLKKLGFVINYTKSSLVPQKECQFLGFILNSKQLTLELPVKKKNDILSRTSTMLNAKAMSIRSFARYLGTLTAACPAVKYSWLYIKSLERVRYLELLKNNDDYDQIMNVPSNIHDDLLWWKRNILISSNPIKQPDYILEIFTDASLAGWGSACNGEKIGGSWNQKESNHHINYLELLAAFFGLKSFARDYRNSDILLRVDNTTAIAYINKMGGIQYPHLNDMAKQIWTWCEKRNIHVFASYIKSCHNTDADKESRNIDIEWELNNHSFRSIVTKFGRPDIDIFASRINAKCTKYISWKRDPYAFNIDAFTRNPSVAPTSFPGSECVVREALTRRRVPQSALNIMLSSLSRNTISQYNSSFKQWWQYCNMRGIDAYDIQVHDLLDFLAQCLEKGSSYGTLNNHRSALALISRNNLSQDDRIKRPHDENRLILTTKNPIHAASSQTIGRWLKQTLASSGIDTGVFSGHSTRHAATSAARRAGVSVDTIRRSAGWSAQSLTFANFYNRPITDQNPNFVNALFDV
ncbi:hypothetical protein MSG28_002401 [Choristoneura fumiferana]|uniref:Uncharacterized protein n=1 Tax=Choristoneura fumiferana TaxID=7141 RepID=A0ACC0JVT4_CHOFU|nr:hypothetical protein MSG28_002401 [Choristoneura fumiferana]